MGDIVEKNKDDQSTDLIREDDAPVKRVELSVHTSMSRPEGVNPVEGMMERAALWGHKAIAITDHGDIQAFSDAYQHLKKLRKTYPNFKVMQDVEQSCLPAMRRRKSTGYPEVCRGRSMQYVKSHFCMRISSRND